MEADGVDRARFPKVRDHFKRMSERPTVKKAISAEIGQGT
jgi:glutathione S-transferase